MSVNIFDAPSNNECKIIPNTEKIEAFPAEFPAEIIDKIFPKITGFLIDRNDKK